MSDPPSAPQQAGPVVVVFDEQDEIAVDHDRWAQLLRDVLRDEGADGELTLTFVDRHEIAALNEQHRGHHGPTDVLSFPIDGRPAGHRSDVPVLLGDVVVCPSVAAEQAPTHERSLDDELALLVVHGALHVLGHDHAHAHEAATMNARQLELLEAHHWRTAAPAGFVGEQDG